MKPLSEPEKAYLAGAIDGEGCVFTYKANNRGYMGLEVANTNEDFIKYVATLIGGRIYLSDPKGRLGIKPCFHVRLYRRDELIPLLKGLLPYLIIKKQKAIEILCWAEANPPIIGTAIHRKKISEGVKRKWQDLGYRRVMALAQRAHALKRWGQTYDQEQLHDLYWNQRMSINQIARTLKKHPSNIHRVMRRMGIPRRKHGEAESLSRSLK